ncbi:MAG: aminoacyl-tRNA hydrolase [Patescibacteria group bacterium]
MKYTIVGLGNPGDEYASTRHNVGKELVEQLKDKLSGAKVIELNVYMNNSGPAIKKAIGMGKNLVVVHDELDMPLGRVKISYGSSAGGHNGVKSIEKALKTKEYVRVRVGISNATAGGKLRRPAPEKITDFVLGKFKPADKEKLKKVKKLVGEALELLIEHGKDRAMSEINSR